MYTKKVLPSHFLVTNQNWRPIINSDVQTHKAYKQDDNFADIAVSLAPLTLVFFWVFVLLFMRKFRHNFDDKMILKVRSLQKVPCKNCQFFCNNNYLKCAVNPHIVLTEEAINCPEYSPKKVNFIQKNFLDRLR
ncbi:hypothetical protein B6N60_01310 [Richelia sinica FACHB-800]|uniref:Uncharacterized protein n=1 Tax=Richelia sinica FACHB-800 TaxID=1357546 RepID=A0A975T655_9NOST|nr:hypothetical protein [Richelia sinica]MBD2663795.1 hypothetical protein [Richelia sinica FACHB-800]QXE22625.1 hypothetical protein B6N60_01310 [Richelia sinica FACHB-800]